MSDETKNTETTDTSQDKEGKVVFDSQADFDAVIQRRVERATKKHATELEELSKKVETLETEKKEREGEQTEIEKLQTQQKELTEEVEKLKPKAEKWDSYEEKANDEVEKQSEGLSDEQKTMVDAMVDPWLKLSLIKQFKEKESGPAPKPIKGQASEQITKEELVKMANDPDPEVRKQAREIHERRKKDLGATDALNPFSNV